jgi:hypothetical protein
MGKKRLLSPVIGISILNNFEQNPDKSQKTENIDALSRF